MQPIGKRIFACAAAAWAGSTAEAQTFITLDLRVTHEVLQPGQAQTIEVWASFTPFPKKVAPGVTSEAFGRLIFDVLNRGGFETGTVTNHQQAFFVASRLGLHDSKGDLLRSLAVQVPPPGTFNGANPLPLLSFDWIPDPGNTIRTIEIETSDRPGAKYAWRDIIVYEPNGFPKHYYFEVDTLNHDSVSWTVLPSPATLALAAGLLIRGRRRRATERART